VIPNGERLMPFFLKACQDIAPRNEFSNYMTEDWLLFIMFTKSFENVILVVFFELFG
jgi:hypothetical protein